MIVDERMVTYINSLDKGNTPFLTQLEKDAKEKELEEKMERWMYLNELMEQIEAQK